MGAVVAPVRSADQPAVGTDDPSDRTVTVERSGRTISITEDESGITVTIVEEGKTTVVAAESALELRAKSRMAHALYQRHFRHGSSRVEANADGKAVVGAAGGIGANSLPPAAPGGAGQIVGGGQLAVGNGVTAGDLLQATKAMASGNRLAWNRAFGATGASASSATGSSVSFRDGGRRVVVSESSTTGITVAITENGETKVVTARTAEELAKKSPEAFRLYQEAGKRARVSVGVGGHASGSANGGANSTASSNGAASAVADGGGLASGGGSATAIARRRVLVRMYRNARTDEERARIAEMLRQLGQ